MKKIITATFAVALAACWMSVASAADVKDKADRRASRFCMVGGAGES